MSSIVPKVASAKDIQKGYRALFDEVIATNEPLFILNNNKPEVVMLSIKRFEKLCFSLEKHEQSLAQKAIKNYINEKKKGRLKKLSSLAELS